MGLGNCRANVLPTLMSWANGSAPQLQAMCYGFESCKGFGFISLQRKDRYTYVRQGPYSSLLCSLDSPNPRSKPVETGRMVRYGDHSPMWFGAV